MIAMSDTPAERRIHPRTPTEPIYLMVAGRPARLLDWSFGGMRVRPEDQGGGFVVGQRVDVTVLRPDGHSWTRLPVTIRHVDHDDGGALGVMLVDRLSAFPLLLELFNHSLARA
ncbi:hypothetical protein CHU95_07610 [Niveispirillum lacus]|uniref:PilZ domain-containing protein n=2 Tax=Niveispirillum lacus TaxID=1981099 RepID=A0A255Z2C8_9PROT|nr:hypothetical protein CHU95_07610 [Niveispirillum lacus]